MHMKSLRELYQIGSGPSSSHTFGPERACREFVKEHKDAEQIQVILYGSLALTGKGHLTDAACVRACAPIPCEVLFSEVSCGRHANTMDLIAYRQGESVGRWRVYSIGGGEIKVEGRGKEETKSVYPERNFEEIMEFCKTKGIRLVDYVDQYEQIDDYLKEVLEQMLKTVEAGLSAKGTLPGALKLERVAASLYERARKEQDPAKKQRLSLMAYAYAASEENAAGGTAVTAPTFGSSGVIPSLLCYYLRDRKTEEERALGGLKIAGIIGNLFKTNATISGAQGGCQAEIGVACAMGSSLAAHMEGLEDELIAYAAESGMEHFLGLTCDPVNGYVMIPCIERNAVAALRAVDSALLAQEVGRIKKNKVTLDMIIETMKYTGQKIPMELKETALGGLARVVPVD